MLRKIFGAFALLFLALIAYYLLLRFVPLPLFGHIENIMLVKHNKTQYAGKYKPKDFDNKSVLLLIGCTTSEISDFISSQNGIPAMQDCVYIFMVSQEDAGSIEKTPSCRKDAFIDDSLNELQLARQFYIDYNEPFYIDYKEPYSKTVLVIDKSGKFIDGYEFKKPTTNQGTKLNSRVIGWSNKLFTCNDYDLQSIIDFLARQKNKGHTVNK